MAAIGTVAWTVDLLTGVLVVSGHLAVPPFPAGSRSAVGTGESVLVMAVLIAPFGFLLLRALRRVRWLDPRSRPSEWEKPMRSPARIRTGRW